MWWLLLIATHALAGPGDGELCVIAERPVRPLDTVPEARGSGEAWLGLREALLAQRAPEPIGVTAALSYLPWDDPAPVDDPVAVTLSAAPHPEDPARSLVRVAVRGAPVDGRTRGPIDLVVLVDGSLSMGSKYTNTFPALHRGEVVFDRARWPWTRYPATSRLGLARAVLHELVAELGPEDRLAVIAFDPTTRVVLRPSPGDPDEPLAEAIEGLNTDPTGRPDAPFEVADRLMNELARPCGDRRYLVVSDGGAALGGDALEVLSTIQRSAVAGSTWSGLTLGRGSQASERLEQVAWAGYGHHGYADTPWDARRVYREMLRPERATARDLDVTLDFGGAASQRLDDAPLPSEVLLGLHHVALYEVDAPIGALSASVRWSAGSPVPGEWTKQGQVELSSRPASLAEADPDLRVSWAAAALARQAGDDRVDWEGLSQLVDGARPHHGVDLELQVLLARAAGLQVKR